MLLYISLDFVKTHPFQQAKDELSHPLNPCHLNQKISTLHEGLVRFICYNQRHCSYPRLAHKINLHEKKKIYSDLGYCGLRAFFLAGYDNRIKG
jgi:hypothetical protein